jgi:hypothetical protein
MSFELLVGPLVGLEVGEDVGLLMGLAVGPLVGLIMELDVGPLVGLLVGLADAEDTGPAGDRRKFC